VTVEQPSVVGNFSEKMKARKNPVGEDRGGIALWHREFLVTLEMFRLSKAPEMQSGRSHWE